MVNVKKDKESQNTRRFLILFNNKAMDKEENLGPMKLIFNYNNIFCSFFYDDISGCIHRSLNSNGGRNATSPIPWINFPLMSRAGEIENAVMILHGEKAHSFYFGNDAYKKLTVTPGKENNKLFMVIPGASHTNLYDQKDIIPFAQIENFFREYLDK